MGKVGVIMGAWSGDLAVTSLVFPTYDIALEYANNVLHLFPNVEDRRREGDGVTKIYLNEDALKQETGNTSQVISYGKKVKSRDGFTSYIATTKDDPEAVRLVEEYGEPIEKGFFSHFFTSYYGGCGECYALIVQEVEFCKPFMKFDFD